MSLINSLILMYKRHLLCSLCINYIVQNDKILRAKVIYVDHLKIKRFGNFSIFAKQSKKTFVLTFVYFKL